MSARWDAVMAALAVAYADHDDSLSVSDDDQGMHECNANELVMWCEDLRDRVGMNVDAMQEAMYAYLDERESPIARALLVEAGADPDKVQELDPRGIACAGAEVLMGEGEAAYFVGLYMDECGRWECANWRHSVDDSKPVDVTDEHTMALDRTLAVATLRAMLADTSLRARLLQAAGEVDQRATFYAQSTGCNRADKTLRGMRRDADALRVIAGRYA